MQVIQWDGHRLAGLTTPYVSRCSRNPLPIDFFLEKFGVLSYMQQGVKHSYQIKSKQLNKTYYPINFYVAVFNSF